MECILIYKIIYNFVSKHLQEYRAAVRKEAAASFSSASSSSSSSSAEGCERREELLIVAAVSAGISTANASYDVATIAKWHFISIIF
jgi:hypothetical protein